MVPHETIEQKIIDVFELSGEDERPIAIVGVQDEAKGEALVSSAQSISISPSCAKNCRKQVFQTCGFQKTSTASKQFRFLPQGNSTLARCTGNREENPIKKEIRTE